LNYPFLHKFDRTNYSMYYLARQLSEAQVQAEIVDQLRALHVDVIAIDAGGKKTRGMMLARAKQQGAAFNPALMSTKTDLKGFPDLEATLAPDGRALYIEVKAPEWIEPDRTLYRTVRKAHKPTQEQLDFLMSKHERGALVMVAWSVSDVFRIYGGFIEQNERYLRAV
jgi:hypothetical protein